MARGYKGGHAPIVVFHGSARLYHVPSDALDALELL